MAVNIGRNTIKISSLTKIEAVFMIATANFILLKTHRNPRKDNTITAIRE